MLTDNQIKTAIKEAPDSGKKSIPMSDGGVRGAGRLTLILRPLEGRVLAEWYAVYYRSGSRALAKMGVYPTLSLADARKIFREKYAPVISAGDDPTTANVRHRRSRGTNGTVKDLFEAYVASLRQEGKRSADMIERTLLSSKSGAARTIGENRPAGSVRAEHIVPHLAAIHGRGAAAMAAQARSYIGAAFAFGMKAANSYKNTAATTKWGIASNPVNTIGTDSDAQQVGERFLSPAEFRILWNWTVNEYKRTSCLIPVIQLQMATGQRVEEILRISTSVFDAEKSTLFWEKTKNKLPHSIPISPLATAILKDRDTAKSGLYFPGLKNNHIPAHYGAVEYMIDVFLKAHPEVEPFTPRDLRRTWKTLAGDAGLSKDIRDRLQNHTKRDVSGRHYDRYDYMSEKRAAVAKWAAYMDLVISGKIVRLGERDGVVVPIGSVAA